MLHCCEKLYKKTVTLNNSEIIYIASVISTHYNVFYNNLLEQHLLRIYWNNLNMLFNELKNQAPPINHEIYINELFINGTFIQSAAK